MSENIPVGQTDRSVYVAICPSMEDWLPDCHACQRPIENWRDAVLIATSSIGPYDEADGIAAIHRSCPDA